MAGGLALPLTATTSTTSPALDISNSGAGTDAYGIAAHGGAGSSGLHGVGGVNGVFGETSGSGTSSGVLGQASASGGTGVTGKSPAGEGVHGEANGGIGVRGISGLGYGVWGSSTFNWGILAETASATEPALRSNGVLSAIDAHGTTYGLRSYVTSSSGFAVTAEGGHTGVSGTGSHTGVFGTGGANGIYGLSSSNTGYGVNGGATGTGYGVYGISAAGDGTYGKALTTGKAGIVGVAANGADTNYAGFFVGNVSIDGTVSATTANSGVKNFKIDHPLDPAGTWLYHTSIESPDMKNLYDGVVTTSEDGFATVQLPKYFEALNRDFRYQLTVVGGDTWARARIASEVSGNAFVIETDQPHITVSWQVTGIRHDAFAEAHRTVVEVPKTGDDLGTCIELTACAAP